MAHFEKKSDQGQSILEYTVILILVMGGIIIGGPYAIRSWNAQIQGWDDSIKVSIQDPLQETPPDTINVPDCTCGGWAPGGCNTDSTTNPDGPCDWNELYQQQTCTPVGCNPIPTERCVVDNSCCMLDPAATQPTLPDDCGSPVKCYDDPVSGTPVFCLANEACFEFVCGNNVPKKACVADPRCYTCTGILPPEGPPFGPPAPPLGVGKKCPGDWTGLTSFTPIHPVANGACTAADKCEFECEPPYFPRGGTCDSCGLGNAYQGSCPDVDQCETGIMGCTATQCAY